MTSPHSGRPALANRIRALPGLVANAPRGLTITLGSFLACAGAFLLTRPITGLGVLGWYVGISCVLSGAADLASLAQEQEHGPDQRRGWFNPPMVAAWAWILVGVAIIAWVGRSPDFLGPVVASMLVVSGGAALLRLVWDRSAERWLAALFGLSEVAFGLLALVWPDATLVIIAILFGGRTAIFGLSLIWRGLFSGRGVPNEVETGPGHPGRRRMSWITGLRWVAAALVLLIAGSALLVSHAFRDGTPVADAFYDAPRDVPATPGRLVRWEPYAGDLPEGMKGYRLLYVTTNAADQPVLASAALAVPRDGTAAVPLISWAHGTVGVARGCAPTIGREAITEDGMPAMDSLYRNRWAMVATDYPGMGTEGNFPYLVGQGQGRAVLDAARAAHQLPDVHLTDQTAIWGHSQGGHAALWAGALAATYAPELDVVGTAALSPASNPEAIAQTVLSHPEMVGASLGVSFVVDAYTRYYDNLTFDQLVAPSATAIVREAAARCTSEASTLITALTGLAIAKDQPILQAGALDGPFGDRLRQNIPTGPWSAPLFIAQGEADEVIPFTINKDYVAGLCRIGVDVQFQGYPGGTHMSILATGTPLSHRLEQWTRARLEGEPAKNDCD